MRCFLAAASVRANSCSGNDDPKASQQDLLDSHRIHFQRSAGPSTVPSRRCLHLGPQNLHVGSRFLHVGPPILHLRRTLASPRGFFASRTASPACLLTFLRVGPNVSPYILNQTKGWLMHGSSGVLFAEQACPAPERTAFPDNAGPPRPAPRMHT